MSDAVDAAASALRSARAQATSARAAGTGESSWAMSEDTGSWRIVASGAAAAGDITVSSRVTAGASALAITRAGETEGASAKPQTSTRPAQAVEKSAGDMQITPIAYERALRPRGGSRAQVAPPRC